MNIDHIWHTTSIAKAFLSCSLSKNRLHSKFTHTRIHSRNEFEKKKAMKQKTKNLYTKKKELEEKQCYKTRAVFYYNTVLKINSFKNKKKFKS
jgi:hypothetical protein